VVCLLPIGWLATLGSLVAAWNREQYKSMSRDEDQPRTKPFEPEALLRIRGARVHNLKNLNVDIPRDQFVVLTGPSGSGKSSLAFDTIFAEGQRQFIESLSVYARQFLDQLERPDVDWIGGLQPTICIDQRPGNLNPRSTVATVTEIYDYLRLLLARLGQPSCHQCGTPIRQQTATQIQERLLELAEGTRLMVLAPLVRGRRGVHEEVFQQIRKAGLVRARVDGEVYELDQVPELSPRKVHQIDAVVDRLVLRPGVEGRLAESLRLAIQLADGLVTACFQVPRAPVDRSTPETPTSAWTDELFSTVYACPSCGLSLQEIEPRTFSFNSPYGACPACEGLGSREEFDPELVLPDRTAALATGVLPPWKSLTPAKQRKLLESLEPLATSLGADWQQPLATWSPKQIETLLHGNPSQKIDGILTLLEKEFATATQKERQEALAAFRGRVVCRACGGARLRPEALSVVLGGRRLADIVPMSVGEATVFFSQLEFPPRDQPIAQPLLREIRKRLNFLSQVGLNYLTLDRSADTLSGGEAQRVRLATGIGSGLVGVCYVLDEPSIGLHQRDNQRLIDALRDLQQQGNTVLVVEHDEAMMRQADHLLDLGPGAGIDGGQLVSQGTPHEMMQTDSLTARYLSGRCRIEIPAQRRRISKSRTIRLEGASLHNLRNVDVSFPLGCLVGITGVSGSGKSSLINETLAPALMLRLGGSAAKPGPFVSLRGVNQIDKVIQVDQAPIGRTPRSNPATYLGLFDDIRKVYAETRDARQRGYRASRFSFNAQGGRCEACQGHGVKRIEMNFLPDLYVTCDECGGSRFNRQTLQVHYRGRSIADILNMPISEACAFFENFAHIHRPLACLVDVGLGYLPLGQPSNTLSGGEAQRVKLAAQLARVDTGKTLYLLDEPTTGLHFDDLRRLLLVLQRLVDKGNSVIVIEHNLDVIKTADWLIDLGPEGGAGGGQVVAEGTPEQLAELADNHTGRFLRPFLASEPNGPA
jgi:excinuclease ABC subunit A